jgi:hypothetical protein
VFRRKARRLYTHNTNTFESGCGQTRLNGTR